MWNSGTSLIILTSLSYLPSLDYIVIIPKQTLHPGQEQTAYWNWFPLSSCPIWNCISGLEISFLHFWTLGHTLSSCRFPFKISNSDALQTRISNSMAFRLTSYFLSKSQAFTFYTFSRIVLV